MITTRIPRVAGTLADPAAQHRDIFLLATVFAIVTLAFFAAFLAFSGKALHTIQFDPVVPGAFKLRNWKFRFGIERGSCRCPGLQEEGFTLLELLVVMAIIAILLILVAPAFTSMKSGSDFTNAVYGIQGLLENARTYAKANRTYVLVGFAEVDASVDPSVSPQVTTGATPCGRVAVALVASKDGTRQFQYATSGQGSDWTANYSNGSHLFAVGKLQVYENLDFIRWNFGSWPRSTHPNSKMARYQPTAAPYILSGDWSGVTPATPFSWPLGSALNSGQYNFTRVIYFDPTGIARSATSTNADAIAHVMEIDLQPTHGTLVPPNPTNQDVGNLAVIQLGNTDGAVRVYRP